MTPELETPRSRRAILGASLGALAATVASAFGRPSPASAVDVPVLLGVNQFASATTEIENSTNSSIIFWANSVNGIGIYSTSGSSTGIIGGSSTGTGVSGIASNSGQGVRGVSSAGNGIEGLSSGSNRSGIWGDNDGGGVGVAGSSVGSAYTTRGVQGTSTNGYGIYGWSSTKTGILGQADSQTAIHGQSGTGTVPAGPAKTGVYGYAAQDTSARGVYGKTTVGYGVYGVATTGTAIRGIATSGTGGFFATGSPSSGTGLRAQGRVRFDHAAGIATIPSGASSVLVTPGTDLVTTSAVVATLMGNAGGSTAVKRVSVDVATNKFTIFLTANSTASVQVAWHVFG
jgi:hypothetical protein